MLQIGILNTQQQKNIDENTLLSKIKQKKTRHIP